MYEVFLTSVVTEKDFASMCAVLCGLCEAPQPWKTIERVLYYQGPAVPTGMPKQKSVDQVALKQDPANPGLWKELHNATLRQSYLLTAQYEVTREQFGPSVPPMDFNATKGILRFSDLPDQPPATKPLLMQRKIVEIWEQKNLLAVLQENGYTYWSEMVTEKCQLFRDNVEFLLMRQYQQRPAQDYEDYTNRITGPLESLPPWDSLQRQDELGRWMMFVKVHVPENKPEELVKAQDTLMGVKRELEGAVEFLALDRRVHDSRVFVDGRLAAAAPI